MSYHYLFKMIVVGDCGVGKSCVLRRFERDTYDSISPSTIGIEFVRRKINIENKELMVQIWDTAGQENLFSLAASYFRNSCAVIFVFDVTSRASFDHIKKWMTQVQDNAHPAIQKILIANKIDLDFQRVVKKSEGEEFAKKNNMLYAETTAKNSKGIQEAFIQISKGVLQEVQNGVLLVDSDGKYGVKAGELSGNKSPQNKNSLESTLAAPKKNQCCNI